MARITRTKVSNTKTAGAKASKIRPKPTAKAPAARASRPRGTRWPKPVPPEAVLEIFQRFAAANPHPHGELLYKNPFTLLIAVVLSAQATDAGVNKATPALFALADTPEKMLALGEDKVRDLVKTIGLYRAKAKNIIGLSRALIERFGSEVPRTREELETLPGVGRKTANVVLNNAFDQPTIAVDTHVFRVSNRISPRPRQDAGGRRGRIGENHPRRLQTARASLADPAWTLHLPGA